MSLKTVKESKMSAFAAFYIWNTHLFLQLFPMISAIFTILIRFDNEAIFHIFLLQSGSYGSAVGTFIRC